MRNELRIAGLWAVILLTVSASGQTAAPNTPASAVPILQGAALPMYPPIAKAAHVTGKVVVRVTVKDGLMVQTEVLSKPAVGAGGRLLESPTLENLKTWRFAADVTGAFTVTYTYEISGTETEKPTNAKVEMLPSLDVKLTARPVKPTVMYQKQSSPAAYTSPHESGHAQGTPSSLEPLQAAARRPVVRPGWRLRKGRDRRSEYLRRIGTEGARGSSNRV